MTSLIAVDSRNSSLTCRRALRLLCDIEALIADHDTAPCTTDDEDDTNSFSSSLSSHSQNDDDCDCPVVLCNAAISGENEDRRLIFSQYWRTTGQEPLKLVREYSRMPRSRSGPNLALLDGEAVSPRPDYPVAPTSNRRSIFELDRSKALTPMRSLPEMNSIPLSGRMMPNRKQRSTSCSGSSLERLPSCLRTNSSLTSSERRPLSVSSSSVRFDTHVKVISFERPLENWTDGSWADLFGTF